MEQKKDIRARILKERTALSEDAWNEKSIQIYKYAIAHPLFLEAEEIYCYVDFRKEVQTRRILKKAWSLGKKVAVPKVIGKEMRFFYIADFHDLQSGYMGIDEPITTTEANAEKALLIMPGAVFSTELNRIGYGGGYYDKYIEKHASYTRMALAFSLQIVNIIPSEAHDKKPEIIITEDGNYESDFITKRPDTFA